MKRSQSRTYEYSFLLRPKKKRKSESRQKPRPAPYRESLFPPSVTAPKKKRRRRKRGQVMITRKKRVAELFEAQNVLFRWENVFSEKTTVLLYQTSVFFTDYRREI